MPITGSTGYVIFIILFAIPLALVFGAVAVFLRRGHL